jgi:hypothetical protein
MQAQIRATPAKQFAAVDQFIAMHQQGALMEVSTTAKAMLDLLASSEFGHHTLDDVRTHTS